MKGLVGCNDSVKKSQEGRKLLVDMVETVLDLRLSIFLSEIDSAIAFCEKRPNTNAKETLESLKKRIESLFSK